LFRGRRGLRRLRNLNSTSSGAGKKTRRKAIGSTGRSWSKKTRRRRICSTSAPSDRDSRRCSRTVTLGAWSFSSMTSTAAIRPHHRHLEAIKLFLNVEHTASSSGRIVESSSTPSEISTHIEPLTKAIASRPIASLRITSKSSSRFRTASAVVRLGNRDVHDPPFLPAPLGRRQANDCLQACNKSRSENRYGPSATRLSVRR